MGKVNFKPVDVGNLAEIPPDLPDGHWNATCKLKLAATSKDSFPMLILNWKATEDLTGDNEDFVGKSATDFVTFFPKGHNAEKMGKIKLKALCEGLGIEIPAITKISSEEDLKPLMDELDGLQAEIWTKVETRKDTGEENTRIFYSAPGGGRAKKDEEEDEDERPATKKKAAGSKGRR